MTPRFAGKHADRVHAQTVERRLLVERRPLSVRCLGGLAADRCAHALTQLLVLYQLVTARAAVALGAVDARADRPRPPASAAPVVADATEAQP